MYSLAVVFCIQTDSSSLIPPVEKLSETNYQETMYINKKQVANDRWEVRG